MSEFHERNPGSNHGGNRLPGISRRVDRASYLAGTTVEIELPVTLKNLGDALSVRYSDLLKLAWRQYGFGSVNITSELDADQAIWLASELGFTLLISE